MNDVERQNVLCAVQNWIQTGEQNYLPDESITPSLQQMKRNIVLKRVSGLVLLIGLSFAFVFFYAKSEEDKALENEPAKGTDMYQQLDITNPSSEDKAPENEPAKGADMYQKLGITNPSSWDFIISEADFSKIHEHTYAVILALKFGTVIYKDIDGKIVTSHQDIAITTNAVISSWNYKENTMDKNVTHKHPKRPKSQQGTGLKVHNVLWLEDLHEWKKGPNKSKLNAIIVSTGMDDELGVADDVIERYQRTVDRGHPAEIEEFHVLNSRKVPEMYLKLLNKYKGGVSVLLHITSAAILTSALI